MHQPTVDIQAFSKHVKAQFPRYSRAGGPVNSFHMLLTRSLPPGQASPPAYCPEVCRLKLLRPIVYEADCCVMAINLLGLGSRSMMQFGLWLAFTPLHQDYQVVAYCISCSYLLSLIRILMPSG